MPHSPMYRREFLRKDAAVTNRTEHASTPGYVVENSFAEILRIQSMYHIDDTEPHRTSTSG